jgi:probable rRNA maturation factor
MTSILVVNQHPSIKLNTKAIKALAKELCGFAETVAKRNGAPIYDEITLIFTDAEQIAEAHAATMNIPTTTDVITLPYEAMPGVPLCAELIISIDMAKSKARANWDANRELALYIAHGIDHLAGNDDHEPHEYRAMRARELRWLRFSSSLKTNSLIH